MLEQLKAPFPPEKISWRVGAMTKDKSKAMAIAYIDARDVMDRLDNAVGPANWQSEYSHTHPAICRIGIKIDGEWVWKSNGAGDTDVEAEKGALSAAFKRAAVLWGIGRYLYDVKSPWVAVDKYKKILGSEKNKLKNCLPSQPPQDESPFVKDELTPQRKAYQKIYNGMFAAQTAQEVQNVWADNESHRKALPDSGQEKLLEVYKRKMNELKDK